MDAIIVTADDFALSREITAGVCRACRHGVVTEASILIRSPWAAESIVQGRDAGLSIGLHLDLVTPFVEHRSRHFGPGRRFVNELAEREFQRRVGKLFDDEELTCARDEMRSQIEDFAVLAGCLPSHLDYHYGLHYLPEVMAICLMLAEEYDLPVRWGSQYAGANPYRLAPACMCDGFRGQEDDGVQAFLSLVDQPCDGIKEILCHPGYTTPGPLPDAYNHGRELELATLTDPRLKEELETRHVKLVTYDWLRHWLAPAASSPDKQEF
jgi:predicted glycoside hydrolase/deacetylase ChbG (UPF0249 family)